MEWNQKLHEYFSLNAERIEHSPEDIILAYYNHLHYTLGKDTYSYTPLDAYMSLAYAVRDQLIANWLKTQQQYYKDDVKRMYYLSMEYLMGRTLGNSLINLGLLTNARDAMHQIDLSLEEIQELEIDAGLGNGGLGRLAACYLDSMATLQIPGFGYGIRYEYGMFFQHFLRGCQVETPDNWLRYGNPWELARPELLFPVRFGGQVSTSLDKEKHIHYHWKDSEIVMAMAYDTPIPGYRNNTVNTLRLWSAKSSRDLNLDSFNKGLYIDAVVEKDLSETISKVLYPNDKTTEGKELRLRQEYFFVSATLQDIFRRFEKIQSDYDLFPEKIAIHLNDTHPAIAIAELMRIFMDDKGLTWDKSWEIANKVFAFTNHTILPESLESWSSDIMQRLLPRHQVIITEINRRFLDRVIHLTMNDPAKVHNLSIITESQPSNIQMAKLAIVGSHSVNGVSKLHTDLLKTRIFKEFYELEPEKFISITNGITQRRWLMLCNPRLSELITNKIGDDWGMDLSQLKMLLDHIDEPDFLQAWQKVKNDNKHEFSAWIKEKLNFTIPTNSILDFQVKRIHEYKRQLLNILHVIHLYCKILKHPDIDMIPRTVIFAGKAAPGYDMAKLIIHFINSVAYIVNHEPRMKDKLKVIFIPNYNVTLAERIFPAADLSEQISTAGMEASGTGNMKFSLNGALTIGTLDGANIEIREAVGADNFFLFGNTADEIQELKVKRYNPRSYYMNDENIREVLDLIDIGHFDLGKPKVFQPIIDSLLNQGDQYFLLADFASYISCQETVETEYRDQHNWTRKSIINVANMGVFSSDRAVQEYTEKIWKVKPIPIP
ncbi:MAG TPA: glycogen/starch/alpha-glucan phosphorylase [Candidatus Cloacimonadota bacterium]|nr:glycogen/starch/alpha-glucan phosphorylase [Candidatus Cloacimonadota bacterium]